METGRIVILNGAPRSGKSSIAAAIQGTFDGIWVNLGVDAYARVTPPNLQPGLDCGPAVSIQILKRFCRASMPRFTSPLPHIAGSA